jgi:hypothetical protein
MKNECDFHTVAGSGGTMLKCSLHGNVRYFKASYIEKVGIDKYSDEIRRECDKHRKDKS